MEEFYRPFVDAVTTECNENAKLIAGIIIGMVFVVLYNRFVGERRLRQSYESLISSK